MESIEHRYTSTLYQNCKGFSLIEIAIVLVIIGVIVGAVIKGQDLIENAKTKKFISKFRLWELSYWTFYDRRGRIPGDNDQNGLIGKDFNIDNFRGDITSISLSEPPYEGTQANPSNTITVESTTVYVFFGSDWGLRKNIIVLCGHRWCDGNFTQDQIKFIEALDVAIDGISNGTSGRLIGAGKPNSWNTGNWTAVYESTPTAMNWGTNHEAAVYYIGGRR